MMARHRDHGISFDIMGREVVRYTVAKFPTTLETVVNATQVVGKLETPPQPDDHFLLVLGLDSIDMTELTIALEAVYGLEPQQLDDYINAKHVEHRSIGTYNSTPRLLADFIDGILTARNPSN